MIRKILALGLLVGLVGCADKDPAVTVAQGGISAIDCTAAGGYKPLPGGLELGLDGHMRSDRIFKDKKGATRRRVTYEMLKGSRQDAIDTVEAVMENNGYAAESRRDSENGDIALPYKKSKSPRLWVKFKEDVGKNPANPEAKYLVLVEWQVKAAPKPERK